MPTGAIIRDIAPDTPADDAGFVAGCRILRVDGQPVRDIIDWRWLSADDEITVSYIDTDGDAGDVTLEREPGEDWGFAFDGAIFDDVHTCRNACTFCFMRQLPTGMRPSLVLRDDDFRLSFLTGTFVTLTNLTDDDARRIVEQHISPLRVSLHAVDPQVRRALIGKHAPAGIASLERLLEDGIEFDAQIVLVPGVNDGSVLDETLEWAYTHPGIKTVGVVPLGFTKHQQQFDRSFDDPVDALRVLTQIERFQNRALSELGEPWVYAADEFYVNAYGADVLEKLPDTDFYGDFSMFEDGIGIVRSTVDDFAAAIESGDTQACADALDEASLTAVYVEGASGESFMQKVVDATPLAGRFRLLPVENRFFGGNVDVTGLLCGEDIARAIAGDSQATDASRALYLIPSIVFNADGLTLDDWTADDIRAALPREIAAHVHIVPSNPIDCIQQLRDTAGEYAAFGPNAPDAGN